MWRDHVVPSAWILAVGILACAGADAAEIRIISGPATAPILAQLGPQFERDTNNKLTSEGGVTGVLKQLIGSGEQFEVAIIPGWLMDDFVKQGKITAGTSKPFVRVGMGVAIRSGTAKPDISSVEKFRQALLNAKSVTFVSEGETAARIPAILDRLGIAKQMKPKSDPQPTVGAAIRSLADGKAELYVSLISIIASAKDKNIELVGPLPPEVQDYLVINTGVGTGAKEPEAAEALIRFLMSSAADPVIQQSGLERATSR